MLVRRIEFTSQVCVRTLLNVSKTRKRKREKAYYAEKDFDIWRKFDGMRILSFLDDRRRYLKAGQAETFSGQLAFLAEGYELREIFPDGISTRLEYFSGSVGDY